MNYLFYAVLFMGALLLIVTLSSWFSTKRKINQYDASVSRTESFIKGIKNRVTLWYYYFIGGNKKNLIRNIVISCLAFFALFIVNVAYVHVDRLVFCLLFGVAFILYCLEAWPTS
ncbi:Uncharacterised protein [Aggregatibacter aphrophilus]|nr:Uncharacterised protein [Aggregatibacter aphrophilus]